METLPLRDDLSNEEMNVLQWHAANLEYGCAGRLDKVSNTCWDQDDESGGFLGHHVMFPKGYGSIVDAMVEDGTIDVRTKERVIHIKYEGGGGRSSSVGGSSVGGSSAGGDDDGKKSVVEVKTESSVYVGDACVVTVPLGVLKKGDLTFVPPLPLHKRRSIDMMGAGILNKVILEFENTFWDENVDMFGRVVDGSGKEVVEEEDEDEDKDEEESFHHARSLLTGEHDRLPPRTHLDLLPQDVPC